MSLRRRLVVGMLALLVLAVVVTDVVTQSELRSYLYGRLDEQDDVAETQAYSYLESVYIRAVDNGQHGVQGDPGRWLAQLALPSTSPLGRAESPSVGSASPAPVSSGLTATEAEAAAGAIPRVARLNPMVLADRVSPDIYVEVLDSSGQVLLRRPSGSAGESDPAPVLPTTLPTSSAPPVPHFGTSHGAYLPQQPDLTLSATGQHGAYYLAEALSLPGGRLVVATPIAPSEATLASLRRVELFVSLVVVLVLLVLVLWTVRLGLRPLEDMTETARAIAGGDLRRRIRRSDNRGEVGRLGAALNGMLTQIEAAFSERTASEARLRRFVADASHELRTPLTSIRGYAELLRKGALDDEEARRRAAERIEHEATRMGVLVDDLLLLARLDQGRPLERSRVDLAEVVSRAVEGARAADPDRPLSLSAREPLLVEGDAGRLRQVADNLLHNASVHTPPGTPVRVEVRRQGHKAELVVADEGPGLGQGEAQQVFDRFYRGTGARGRPGTGLGLSIVAALAAAHGGAASVRPGAERGVEFVVELPLAEEDRPPRARVEDVVHADPRADTEHGASAAGVPPDDTMATNAPDVGEPARR